MREFLLVEVRCGEKKCNFEKEVRPQGAKSSQPKLPSTTTAAGKQS